MSLLAYPTAVYSIGTPNYPVHKVVNCIFPMVVHPRSISLLLYPVAVYQRSMSLLAYPAVVYTDSDIILVYPAVVHTRSISLLLYPTTPNVLQLPSFSLPKAVCTQWLCTGYQYLLQRTQQVHIQGIVKYFC